MRRHVLGGRDVADLGVQAAGAMNNVELEAAAAIAANLLTMTEQDARRYCRAVPEADA